MKRMNKELKILLPVILSMLIGVAAATTAHASGDTVTHGNTTYYNGKIANRLYYSNRSKKHIYAWNKSHTKVLYDLKRYQESTWLKSAKTIITKGGKKAVYYRIERFNTGKYNLKWMRKRAYVWHGNLVKGHYPSYTNSIYNNSIYDMFKNDKEYSQYINQSPSQKLTKNITSMFPNTPVSLKLSKQAQFGTDPIKNSVDFSDITNFDNLPSIITFKGASKYINSYKLTDNQKFNYIKNYLNNKLDSKVRNSLNNYRMGIFYNNIDPHSMDQDTYYSFYLVENS